MPFSVSISDALKLLGSNVIIEILSEWVSPSIDGNLLEISDIVRFLSSDVVIWSIWLVWGIRLLVASSSVGSSIVVPFSISIGNAFQLLSSNIVISVFTEWVNVSQSLNLLSDRERSLIN